MSFIFETTEFIKKYHPNLLKVWETVAQEGVYHFEDPDAFRTVAVGIQTGVETEFAATEPEKTFGAIVTQGVGTTYIYDERNLHELDATKAKTVTPRIITRRATLENGNPMVIAAPEAAWQNMRKNKDQNAIWDELNTQNDNLQGVEVDLSDGASGAFYIVGNEAFALRMKQARANSPEVDQCFMVAGSLDNPEVINHLKMFTDPLKAANVKMPQSLIKALG